MGSSSRHRDRSRDRDRDRDRRRQRSRDRHRDRDRRDREHRDRDRRSRSREKRSSRVDRSATPPPRQQPPPAPPQATTTPPPPPQLLQQLPIITLPPTMQFRCQNVEAPMSSSSTNVTTDEPQVVGAQAQIPPNDGEKLIADCLANIIAAKNFSSLLNHPKDVTNDFGAANNLNATWEENFSMDSENAANKKRKRKSRWGGDEHDKIFIPGIPTMLPANLNKDQEKAYLLQLQIEEVTRKLRSGDLGIPPNPEDRSPSPEPIYSSDGKRLNTREFRTRRRLEEQRHHLILNMQQINPEFKPPLDYTPPVIRVSDKVMIPQEEHPEINFVGLLIGPRGNTLKTMEKETGAKIIIRGKGSVKEGKVGRKDGQPLPGEDEPLHAYITATNPECVKKAVEKIKDVIRQGVEVPENQNDLRRMQLRELAQLNGTLRETDGLRCANCGALDHKSWLCPEKLNVTSTIVCSSCGSAGHIAKDCRQKRPGQGGPPIETDKAKIDEEYMSLMAELGEAPPPDTTKINTQQSSMARKPNTFNMFEPQMAPRPLMGPPISAPPPPPHHQMPCMNGGAGGGVGGGMGPPPPPWQMPPNMWHPSGMMAPPPPPPGASSPPQMPPNAWLNTSNANGQPPPPGACPPPPPPSAQQQNGGMSAPPPLWPTANNQFMWTTASMNGVPPPPPPGIDVSSLLAPPPPPPPLPPPTT